MFLIICLVLGLLIFAAMLCYILKIWLVHRRYNHIPGPRRSNLFKGNVAAIQKAWETTKNMNELFHKWTLLYGKTFVMYWGTEPVVLTVEPEAVKEILVKQNFPKSKERYEPVSHLYGERFVGSGFAVQLDDTKWKARRSLTDPLFHRQSLKDFIGTFNSVIDDLMDKLRTYAETGETLTMINQMHKVTLDVIGKIALNKDIGAIHEKTSPFVEAIFYIFKGYTSALMDPFWRIKFWDKRKEKFQVQNACQVLREAGRKWLNDRFDLIKSGATPPDDILTTYINAAEVDEHGKLKDIEEIVDDILIIFVGGQETTGNTMTIAIMQICRHPEILTKVRDEIEAVLNRRDIITFKDLGKLSYIDAVIKETLRLYPVAPMIFRKPTNDVKVGDLVVPGGTTICLSMYASARYPEFQDDPLNFIPERFLGPQEKRPHMFENFPFSLGPRYCIGKNFAMIEIKILLVKLFRNFNVLLDSDQSFEVMEHGTLRPKDGVKCTLTLRNSETVTKM